jgi:hypothetical protein
MVNEEEEPMPSGNALVWTIVGILLIIALLIWILTTVF